MPMTPLGLTSFKGNLNRFGKEFSLLMNDDEKEAVQTIVDVINRVGRSDYYRVYFKGGRQAEDLNSCFPID